MILVAISIWQYIHTNTCTWFTIFLHGITSFRFWGLASS